VKTGLLLETLLKEYANKDDEKYQNKQKSILLCTTFCSKKKDTYALASASYPST
jgi:hypothetical protein